LKRKFKEKVKREGLKMWFEAAVRALGCALFCCMSL
jgi:hypothetical protein